MSRRDRPIGPRGQRLLLTSNMRPMSIKRVGIVGSGIMGSGIAETMAVQRVRGRAALPGTEHGRRHGGGDGEVLAAPGGEGQVARGRPRRATGPGHGGLRPRRPRRCDLVIESVVEDLAVKKHLFTELDRICRDDTILATNTSTLPVVEMAMETGRPDKVCGIHFFNPAPVMSLVEVVRPITASDDTVAAALAFAEACGKTRWQVKDQAGFIVNAAPVPLPQQRRPAPRERRGHRDDIDTAMKGGCGFPMGPFALLDLVGLDTCWPSWTPSTTSSATPTTRPSRCCGAWWPPSPSAGSPAGLLRLPEVERGGHPPFGKRGSERPRAIGGMSRVDRRSTTPEALTSRG